MQHHRWMVEMRTNHLDELLLEPRETLDIEVKDWLDLTQNNCRAGLAKEIIALANHGGGFVVGGFFEENDGSFIEGSGHPGELSSWSQDCIQDIVEKYIHPTFQLGVYHRTHAISQKLYPIISVPGGHRVPIVAKSGSPDGKKLVAHRTYIRRPGPKSEEPQSAEEWNILFERCIHNRQGELLDAMRSIMVGVLPSSNKITSSKIEDLNKFKADASQRWNDLVASLPDNSPARHKFGYHDFSFAIDGYVQPRSLKEMRDTIQQEVKNFAGWPPFVTLEGTKLAPKPVDGSVQAWFPPDENLHLNFNDFWRIDPKGFLFSRTGYLEDTVNNYSPGKFINVSWTIRSFADAVLQAVFIAGSIADKDADLICNPYWNGLRGRGLITHQYIPVEHQGRNAALQDSFETVERVRLGDAENLVVEIVYNCCSRVLELFDFYKLDKRLVEREIEALVSRRF